MRVLVADDHPILRKGLRQILTDEADIVVDEVGTIPALREYMARGAPDVLVLDVNMPGGSGLEVLGEFLKLYPKMPILILSVHPEEQAGVRAMLGGAKGYLSKEAAPERLVEAVRKLRAGGRFVSPELAEAMADYLQRPDGERRPHEALSEREFAVFRLIAAGKGPSEIAEMLHLSPKTVSTYRSRILEKMHMTTNADLTRYMVEHGLDESAASA